MKQLFASFCIIMQYYNVIGEQKYMNDSPTTSNLSGRTYPHNTSKFPEGLSLTTTKQYAIIVRVGSLRKAG